MQALLVERTGNPWVTRFHSLPAPDIAPDQVLVRIEAAGINPLDGRLAAGDLKPVLGYRPPFALGHDLAGVVARVGADVETFAVGDAVYGRVRDGHIGTFAHFIAAYPADLALKPSNLDMVEAASLSLAGLTAWQALVEHAQLVAGERVLIEAGSGGVGTLAIQLAHHLGAEVATTASPASRDWLIELGADEVMDYHDPRGVEQATPPDVVLHSQDQATLRRMLRSMRRGGRLVSISGPPDPDFARDRKLNPMLRAGIQAMSAATRWQAARRHIDYRFLFMRADGSQLAELTRLVEAGHIRPVIDDDVAFIHLPRALRYVASGRAKGKVVVRMT